MTHDAEVESRNSPGRAYFELDGDKEICASKSSESQVPLTWRGDPSETFSDWTIVVVTNEAKTIPYHVHKSVLCFGSRQAKYFARIMLNQSVDQRNKYNQKGYVVPSTKVELNKRDADNLPILLDYIYAPCIRMTSVCTVATAASTATSTSTMTVPAEDDSTSTQKHVENISTMNAVSLRYLAKRFEIDSMVLAVNRFIQKDLNFKTGPHYLSVASEYKDTRLQESAKRLCTENFQKVSPKALLQLPTRLFKSVVKSLESDKDDNIQLSIHLSEMVCRFLEKNQRDLNASTLIELTDPLLMPAFSSDAAIGFTSLIKELDSNDARANWSRLISLSRRCAKSVVQEYGWNDFSVNAAVDEYLESLKVGSAGSTDVGSLLFATSFAAALDQAQNDYDEIWTEQQRLEDMVRSLTNSITTLEECNDRKDGFLLKQKNAIEDAKRQILELKQEIGAARAKTKFQEAPATHSIRTIPSSSSSPIRDLISPSRVGMDVHKTKSRKIQELRTRSEMRTKSIMH